MNRKSRINFRINLSIGLTLAFGAPFVFQTLAFLETGKPLGQNYNLFLSLALLAFGHLVHSGADLYHFRCSEARFRTEGDRSHLVNGWSTIALLCYAVGAASLVQIYLLNR